MLASVAVGFALLYGSIHRYQTISSQEYRYEHIQAIYHKLAVVTGRVNEVPPLLIIDQPILNAFAMTNQVVLYQGLIDFSKDDDEIALVLGHEISHVLLGHLGKLQATSVDEQAVLESMADKMGAMYMMRAGYNICTAREMWKRLAEQYGDFLGGDHPNDAYRFKSGYRSD